jgi:hypothetical protein
VTVLIDRQYEKHNPSESVDVKVKVNLSRYRHATVKGERKYSVYSFLTLELGWVSGQSRPGRASPPGNDPSNHWMGGWVSLRADLDAEAIRNSLVKATFFPGAFLAFSQLKLQKFAY